MWTCVGRPFTGVHVLRAHVPGPPRPLLSGGQGREGLQGNSETVTGRRYVSDDYNVYSLRDHAVVSPVNLNESPLPEGGAGSLQEGNKGREQEFGRGEVLSGVGPVGEGTYTGICSLMTTLRTHSQRQRHGCFVDLFNLFHKHDTIH
jgi:hypothetical protein